MSLSQPLVTVIIAARPDDQEVKSLAASRKLEYPALEIIVARGRQPSVQRNAAARAARGEILYFLDDDSLALPGNIQRALAHFQETNVLMVGGPNLCPAEAPALEQTFALTMGSWLAFGPSCARYRQVGPARPSSEKELILCNLLVRRDAFLASGGFNESLYPNEENALMDALQKQGGTLIYDPGLVVHRRPRPHLRAFVKMLLNYGRGRAEQVRTHPTLGSLPNFVPPFFCLYLLALPFLPVWALWPLALYALLVLIQAVVLLSRGPWARFPGLCLLIFLSHVVYGLGFWKGLFTRLKSPQHQQKAAEVRLENVPLARR